MTIAAAHSHHSCRSSRRKFTRTALNCASLGKSLDFGRCRRNNHQKESTLSRDPRKCPGRRLHPAWSPEPSDLLLHEPNHLAFLYSLLVRT